MAIDHSFTWSPSKLVNLESLKVLVVGGTGGLGRAISKQLAAAGASVTVVGQTFRDEETKNIDFVPCDLSSMKSASELAKKLDVSQVDIVLFTTGIIAAPSKQITGEGLEKDMAVSYLNRLVMVRELVPRMQKTKSVFGTSPRVFYMAYPGDGQLGNPEDLNSEKKYAPMKAHLNTVAGNEALVYDSAKRYENAHFYGLNPGIVRTNIRDNLLGKNSWRSSAVETLVGWFTRSPDQYAERIAPLLIAPELEQRNGGIFNNNGHALQRSKGISEDYAAAYIKASEELLRDKQLP